MKDIRDLDTVEDLVDEKLDAKGLTRDAGRCGTRATMASYATQIRLPHLNMLRCVKVGHGSLAHAGYSPPVHSVPRARGSVHRAAKILDP